MAKQTFTTGQVLTAAQVNSLQANDFNQTVSVKTANYTLVAADKGTRIEFNTSGSVTCTVNTGLFDAGDTVIIQNRGSGTVTVTAGTATVNTNASLAVAQYGYGTLYFISASASIFFADAGGIPASAFTAKGDILVGTGSGTYDDLAVGTNGYTLVADSAETLGVKWAAPAASGMTLITRTTFSSVASQAFDNVFSSTYTMYLVTFENISAATATDDFYFQYRYAGPTTQTASYYMNNYYQANSAATSLTWTNGTNTSQFLLSLNCGDATYKTFGYAYISKVGDGSQIPLLTGALFSNYSDHNNTFAGDARVSRVYTGFILSTSSSNISGTVSVYGLAK